MKRTMLLTVFIALAFCISVSAADITITHLTYTSHGDKYHEYLNNKAAEFNKSHPGIKVEVIIGLHDKFQTMLVGGVPPDVIDLPDFLHLGPAGQLVDLRPLLQRDGLLKAYNPQIIKGMSAPDGAIYSMPFELSMFITFFNRDLFNKNGLNTPERLGAGWNWDAVIQNGKKLTVDENGDGTPEYFGFDRAWGSCWRNAVYQAGGRFYEFDNLMRPVKSLWNTPEVLMGIQWNERIYREGITPHLRVADQTKYYFWTGNTAIDNVDGLGIIGTYLNKGTVDWDMALLPRGPVGPISTGGGSGPHIIADTKHLNEVWEWVKFYTAKKENVEEWIKGTGRMSALLAAQPSYVSLLNLKQKNIAAFFEQANYVAPADANYPLADALNPRKIALDPIWNGSVAAATHLEGLYQKTNAFIQEQLAKK